MSHRGLDVGDRDHQVERVGWRPRESEPLIEVSRRWVERCDHEHPDADRHARCDGHFHRVSQQPGTETVTLNLAVDGEPAEQDRRDLSRTLSARSPRRVNSKHCEGRQRVEADDPFAVRRYIGPRESGDLVPQTGPSQPVVELDLTGVKLVHEVVLAEWLNRAEAGFHSSKGVGR